MNQQVLEQLSAFAFGIGAIVGFIWSMKTSDGPFTGMPVVIRLFASLLSVAMVSGVFFVLFTCVCWFVIRALYFAVTGQ